jgi:hypothetical protein
MSVSARFSSLFLAVFALYSCRKLLSDHLSAMNQLPILNKRKSVPPAISMTASVNRYFASIDALHIASECSRNGSVSNILS